MKPRLSVITLGVDDLEASVQFYRDGLGWPTEGIIGTEIEHGAVAFFDLQHGVKLTLFPRGDLALDAGIDKSAQSPTEFSLGHNVRSEADVDAAMERAAAAGARILKSAQKTFWNGYAGYFKIRTDICGRSPSTPHSCRRTELRREVVDALGLEPRTR